MAKTRRVTGTGEKSGVEPGGNKPIGVVPLMGCRCRCGYEWLPRFNETPRVCPSCKSPNWDRPKRWTRKKAGDQAD